jgi:hypothetical protein
MLLPGTPAVPVSCPLRLVLEIFLAEKTRKRTIVIRENTKNIRVIRALLSVAYRSD